MATKLEKRLIKDFTSDLPMFLTKIGFLHPDLRENSVDFDYKGVVNNKHTVIKYIYQPSERIDRELHYPAFGLLSIGDITIRLTKRQFKPINILLTRFKFGPRTQVNRDGIIKDKSLTDVKVRLEIAKPSLL